MIWDKRCPRCKPDVATLIKWFDNKYLCIYCHAYDLTIQNPDGKHIFIEEELLDETLDGQNTRV